MGFRTGSYAKVWEIVDKGNYSEVSLSTSRKDKRTGNYEKDFSSKFTRFIGDAHRDILGLGNGVKIKLGDIEVTNAYSKEKKQEYVNYLVFSFEVAEHQDSTYSAQTTNSNEFVSIPDGVDDEVPFL